MCGCTRVRLNLEMDRATWEKWEAKQACYSVYLFYLTVAVTRSSITQHRANGRYKQSHWRAHGRRRHRHRCARRTQRHHFAPGQAAHLSASIHKATGVRPRALEA